MPLFVEIGIFPFRDKSIIKVEQSQSSTKCGLEKSFTKIDDSSS